MVPWISSSTVLIFGESTLANALEKRFSRGRARVIRAGKNPGLWHLDMARDPSCWRVPSAPSWVFVCAGITSRERCESQPHATRWVNVAGGIRLARHFSRQGTRMVFFGTDLEPEEGEYARQKEDLRAAVAGLPGVFWIRLGKVVHPGLPVLLGWREQVDAGVVEAWKDVLIQPVTPEAVAGACAALLETREFLPKEMDWNVAPPMTYAEFASRWARSTGRAGSVKIRELPAPRKNRQLPPGTCPDLFRRLLTREDHGAWWSQ